MTDTTTDTGTGTGIKPKKHRQPKPKPKRHLKRRLDLRPRFGSIPDAVRYGGIGRTDLYNKAAQNPGLFVKNGRQTIVDFDKLDAILDELPLAQIELPFKATN
jgi:hypothetical protein